MPIALAVDSVDVSRRKRRIAYIPTLTGSYPTNGDTLDFSAATNPKFLTGAGVPQTVPDLIEAEGSFDGMAITPVRGTTNANSKLKCFSSNDTELAAGAYSANQKADALNCRIIVTVPIGK